MTVIEKANELGQLIRECPEMKALTDAEALQAKDEAAQELIKEFNLKRMNLARDMQEGKLTQEEAIKKNNEAFEEMVETLLSHYSATFPIEYSQTDRYVFILLVIKRWECGLNE